MNTISTNKNPGATQDRSERFQDLGFERVQAVGKGVARRAVPRSSGRETTLSMLTLFAL